jgi:hypothetical protein
MQPQASRHDSGVGTSHFDSTVNFANQVLLSAECHLICLSGCLLMLSNDSTQPTAARPKAFWTMIRRHVRSTHKHVVQGIASLPIFLLHRVEVPPSGTANGSGMNAPLIRLDSKPQGPVRNLERQWIPFLTGVTSSDT